MGLFFDPTFSIEQSFVFSLLYDIRVVRDPNDVHTKESTQTPNCWATTPVCPYLFTITQRADFVLSDLAKDHNDFLDTTKGRKRIDAVLGFVQKLADIGKGCLTDLFKLVAGVHILDHDAN